jgi:hypothetical protein
MPHNSMANLFQICPVIEEILDGPPKNGAGIAALSGFPRSDQSRI